MDLSHLPADTAFSFHVVADAIRRHAKGLPERPALLDVGGHPGLFVREFTGAFPRWSGFTVDMPFRGSGPYLCGSGTALPLRSASFDVAVSLDALAGVPPLERRRFIVELCRVARSHVVLTAPFHHPATAAVERILDQAHRQAFGSPHPRLSEHVEHGLPDLREIISEWPGSFGLREILPSWGLRSWVTWQGLSLLHEQCGGLDRSWESWQRAHAAEPVPPPGPVPYTWVLVARRGASTRPLSGLRLPAPDADADLPELARLYARLAELYAAMPAGNTAAGEINQRLKKALLAAERELEAERTQKALPGLGTRVREALRRWLQ